MTVNRPRPLLTQMWSKYQDVAPSGHASTNDEVAADLEKIGRVIGGAVKTNFDTGAAELRAAPEGSYPPHPVGFTNGCATRMSYVLNNCGIAIPKVPGRTVTGGDHKNYIYRVSLMVDFLESVFGKPDIAEGSGALRPHFLNKKGIIRFGVTFADASGHVTLWDGQRAVDEDYFDVERVRPNVHLLGVGLWLCP